MKYSHWQENDILFFDFGPVFEDWEADLGRTFVIGNDPYKHKLKNDIEQAWQEAREWYEKQRQLTGAEFYRYITGFPNVMAGLMDRI
jgi:Xaa-Pro aminopeptidase